MKKLFYGGIIGIILYEIAKVYFIMPMPGSQQMNSIDALPIYSTRGAGRCGYCSGRWSGSGHFQCFRVK
jgi:hypothetical protein